MGSKPKVVVTRTFPETVEARLRRDIESLVDSDGRIQSIDEQVDHADGADALLPCHCENRHPMDAERIVLLRAGMILINTAHLGLVDYESLNEVLRSGRHQRVGRVQRRAGIAPRHGAGSTTRSCCLIAAAPSHDTCDAMGLRARDNLEAMVAGREPGDRVA